MHAVVPPVGLLEATNAPGTGESDIFHGEREGKRARLKGQRSDRSEQSEVNGSFSPPGGSKGGSFDARCYGSILKILLPTEGRKHFFKKVSRS